MAVPLLAIEIEGGLTEVHDGVWMGVSQEESEGLLRLPWVQRVMDLER